MRTARLITLLLLLLPVMAAAEDAAPADCRATLSPDARLIFDATAPTFTPKGDLLEAVRAAIRDKTRGLVIDGKLDRAIAKPAAHEAGVCLHRQAAHPPS